MSNVSSQQRTLARPAEISGQGLFTGARVNVRLQPADVNSGIEFVRTDQHPPVHIRANVGSLSKRMRRTALRNGTVAIETTEHCLAALSGMGIDNVRIELDGPELPAADGSSLTFVDTIRQAGVTEQEAPRRVFTITEPIVVREGRASLAALPGDEDALEILFDMDYGEGPIGRQVFSYRLDAGTFAEQIAPARTFCLQQEADQMQAAGIGGHLSYKDILVFGPEGPIENELRFENECVRHKILDVIGDLAITGLDIRGRIVAHIGGHWLNQSLARRIVRQHESRDLQARMIDQSVLDIRRISRILPHRYPFLLVDRVIELDGDHRAVGVKNVTINEPFFQGHFPQQPIMPGVLIVEAMAQLSGVLLSQKLEHTGKLAVLLSMDKVKIRRPVVPGDQLILESEAIRVKQRTGHVRCNARVGDELAAEAVIKFMLIDAEPI